MRALVAGTLLAGALAVAASETGDTWGRMSWGHAVSPDMLRWTDLPIALREESGIMAFSGSAVHDRRNTSGLCGRHAATCLVAIYTGHGSSWPSGPSARSRRSGAGRSSSRPGRSRGAAPSASRETPSTSRPSCVPASRLFVDRTRSGRSDFHPAFAGRHSGPLTAENGLVRLRVLGDRSSVEVFGGDGRTVISDRIFPRPTSRGVALFAEGGTAEVVSLRAWPLAPAIRR